MPSAASKVTLHMVASVDFYIAKPDNSIAWLETSDRYDKGTTFEDATAFVRSIGCYVMGSTTYEHARVLGWPYGDTPTIVLTHRSLTAERDTVEFYSGDLRELVNRRLKPKYKSIWVVGGAVLARDFLRANLIDDIRIGIMPIMLGEGTRFVDLGREQPLHLKDVSGYQDGMVELWYEVKK
jgi:dihydrofolate reductase